MAASPKMAKTKTRAKAGSKRAAAARPKKSKPGRKPSPAPKAAARKAAPKKRVPAKAGKQAPKKRAARTRQVPPPAVSPGPTKAFADKVRDCDIGTGVWFVTAGSVEHASLQRPGAEGSVVIRTDAGAVEVVPAANLFETADEARAARDVHLR